MNAETIAKALDGRKAGGGWMARCLAHDDRTPSLSICDADNEKVLLHGNAGCDQDRVIAALRGRGLWAENGPRSLSRTGRHTPIEHKPDNDDATRRSQPEDRRRIMTGLRRAAADAVKRRCRQALTIGSEAAFGDLIRGSGSHERRPAHRLRY